MGRGCIRLGYVDFNYNCADNNRELREHIVLTDYEGRRPRYEDFGERPPLTAEDVAFICEALEDAGKPEDSAQVMDFWYGAKETREEQIRQHLNRIWESLN